MGYNPDNLKKIRAEYEGKHLRALSEAEERSRAVRAAIPGVGEIDAKLAQTGLAVFRASQTCHGEELAAALEELKKENDALLARREKLLTDNGYPADYTRPKYECAKCEDTGALGFRICSCMRKKLIRMGYESSGIGKLIETRTFDSFDPEMQGDDPRAREMAARAKNTLKDFAERFGETDGRKNLLLIGGTGLGKTHLSAAVAGTVIERGYDACCVTASELFGAFESERFNRSYNSDAPSSTERFFRADLLIIDDLGTELSNQFTNSVLCNLLNVRLNNELSTVVNTNLDPKDLKVRYDDRIFSRLLGEFITVPFLGSDVRRKKLSNR
ncbi:MAG: ATP-binding protein [Lachnospiraceae bacterium]|nr:ATP-binding protein [Lachnospiraceae bacterium]